jgi:uncharacterized protein (TIGR03435 family)
MSWKALTGFSVALVLSVACLFGQSAGAQTANETSPLHDDFKFEVASIKRNNQPQRGPGSGSVSLPDGIRGIGTNTYSTLMGAYLPEDAAAWKNASVTNAPDWVTSERYDIDARVADKDLKVWGSQSGPLYEHVYLRAALRNLLKERYKLQAHLVNTQIPYLSIVVNKDHNKLVAVPEIPPVPEGARSLPLPSGGHMTISRDQDGYITWRFFGCTMDDLASAISPGSQEPVQNKTGLEGRYNFQFTANAQEMAEDGLLSEMTGLAKLGIRLQNDKGPGYNLVIDHIERPDAN